MSLCHVVGVLKKHNTSYSTFVCNFTGAENSTSFVDLTGKPITAHGNVHIGTGGQHGYFDGSGDYLTVPDSDDWTTSGLFTHEIFLAFETKTDSQAIMGQWNDPNAWYLWIVSGQLSIRMNSGAFTDLSFTWTPVLGQKYHIAVSRDVSNVLRLYIDGAMVASMTYAAVMAESDEPLVIGAIGVNNAFSGFDFNGKIYGARLTKGQALYATDTSFTVPTLPFTL